MWPRIKSEILLLIIQFLSFAIISVICCIVVSDILNFFKMYMIIIMLFGVPSIIYFVLSIFIVRDERDMDLYESFAIWYGGAILCRILGLNSDILEYVVCYAMAFIAWLMFHRYCMKH